jgi:hypothetical protein
LLLLGLMLGLLSALLLDWLEEALQATDAARLYLLSDQCNGRAAAAAAAGAIRPLFCRRRLGC